MCVARVFHDSRHVREVQVDELRHADQLGNALHATAQHIVRDAERIGERDALVGNLLESLIRDDDQRVDKFTQGLDTDLCLIHPSLTFKAKGLGHDTDRENVHLACDACNDRRRARTGAAAHAGGDEHHVCACKRIFDVVNALFGCALADLWICARAVTARDLFADGDLLRCRRVDKHLLIRVDANKLNAADIGCDHSVDRVVAAAADADYLQADAAVHCLVQFKTHFQVLLHVWSNFKNKQN